jgi:hypothetical protein
MTTLADYCVIKHEAVRVQRGYPHSTHFFDTYSDIATSGGSKRPVLTFFVDPASDADDTHLSVSINGTVIFRYTYSGGVGRSHTVVFDHESLQPTGNRLHIENQTEGELRISDLVVWFQRNIAA